MKSRFLQVVGLASRFVIISGSVVGILALLLSETKVASLTVADLTMGGALAAFGAYLIRRLCARKITPKARFIWACIGLLIMATIIGLMLTVIAFILWEIIQRGQ